MRCSGPALILLFACLLFFVPLIAQPSGILYSDYSDFINYHIPCKAFLVRSFQQTGELPLWCPEMFAGMPFIHDPQVSAFYPLHVPLYFVSPEHIGAVCSWLIVLHVIVAGLCMYAYARHRGLGRVGSLVAGLGFMFAGKWLLHLLVAGHFNVAPLAWLPLVLLWLEQAIERRSVVRALAAGVVFAFIILGTHPQLTFYAGLFIALWTWGFIRNRQLAAVLHPSTERWYVRWAGMGLLTAAVAGLLAAVQILPAMEATAASSRTLGVQLGNETAKAGMRTLIAMVGPPVTTDSSWLWEDRVAFGLLWLVLAACAPVVDRRPLIRLQAGITLLWFLLGIGGVTLLQWLPGFHLWRLPSRMFLLAALPVSLLAGTTVDRLLAPDGMTAEIRERCRTFLGKGSLYILIPLGIYALVLHQQGHQMVFAIYWPLLLATLPLAWWLLGQSVSPTIADAGRREGEVTAEPESAIKHVEQGIIGPLNPLGSARQEPRPPVIALTPLQQMLAVGWVAVLLADLWGIAWPLVSVYPEADLYAPSACVQYLQQRAGERGRVMDINPLDPADHAPSCATPLWPNLGMVVGVEPVRGYNPLDMLRYKEYLLFVMNHDEPLGALDNNLTQPGPGGFPLFNRNLTNLLGVRFLLLPDKVPLEEFVPDKMARQSWQAVYHDASPRTYSFVPSGTEARDAGIRILPSYTVYENQDAMPRAFFVSEAKPIPDRSQLLAELSKTDFRRCVLLEKFAATASREHKRPEESPSASTVQIRDARPNRVTVDVQATGPGYVVLADPWFPGWTCTVDGESVLVHRANFLFRAVEVPAGNHEVVFTLVPRSYAWGKIVSIATLALVVPVCIGGAFRRRATERAP